MTFEIVISILLVLLIPILVYKAKSKKDWSIVASIVPRVYVLIAVILYIIYESIDLEYIHIGLIMVFATDIFVNLLYLFSRKYIKNYSESELIRQLKVLQDKYVFIIDESPIGKYILNSKGEIEFVNQTLASLLEVTKEKLIGKHFKEYAAEDSIALLEEKFREKLNNLGIKTDYCVNLKSASGKIIKVRLISKRVDNGHITILGSVLPI